MDKSVMTSVRDISAGRSWTLLDLPDFASNLQDHTDLKKQRHSESRCCYRLLGVEDPSINRGRNAMRLCCPDLPIKVSVRVFGCAF